MSSKLKTWDDVLNGLFGDWLEQIGVPAKEATDEQKAILYRTLMGVGRERAKSAAREAT